MRFTVSANGESAVIVSAMLLNLLVDEVFVL